MSVCLVSILLFIIQKWKQEKKIKFVFFKISCNIYATVNLHYQFCISIFIFQLKYTCSASLICTDIHILQRAVHPVGFEKYSTPHWLAEIMTYYEHEFSKQCEINIFYMFMLLICMFVIMLQIGLFIIGNGARLRMIWSSNRLKISDIFYRLSMKG